MPDTLRRTTDSAPAALQRGDTPHVRCYDPGTVVEAIPVRLYFQCNWVIMVSRDFEGEVIEGGETLRMYTDDREISLSSMTGTRHDGTPMTAEDILTRYPPREMPGKHHSFAAGDIQGRAVWMEATNDSGPSDFVLWAVVVAGDTGKFARVTIVSSRRDDEEWAVQTWRHIRLGRAPEGVVSFDSDA